MENIVSSEFWQRLFSSLMDWTISELPGVFIMALVLVLLSRGINMAINQFKKVLLRRAESDPKVDTLEAGKRINTLTDILMAVVKVSLYTVFVIMLMSKFGVDVGPLLASAGIIGLAVGFGAQELVRDYISGFFMLLEDQIRTGDVAIINGTGGLVERIELRTITLRDLSGVTHVFQNGKINTLANMTKDWSAMVFDIGVAYKENVDEVMEIMKGVGDDLVDDEVFKVKILEPLEISGLNEFGNSALVIRARFKTRPGEQWTVGREYRRRLKIAFDSHGIEIPFPHTTIYWGDEINPLKLQMEAGEKGVS
ncbi:MAG: mechanosensitive ion channel family protein [Bacteroidales bacterium]|nr:mechanosensitive ion channel family protein [Bacteroidales bacterium]